MYAIEFQTTIKNGVIEIPREYRQDYQKSVRVIVLAEDFTPTGVSLIDQLLAICICPDR